MKRFGALAFSVLFMASCSSDNSEVRNISNPSSAQNQIVGNDRDRHGCIPSAGYSWSQTRSACVRVWEVARQLHTQNQPPAPTGYFLIFNGLSKPIELFNDKNQSFILEPVGQYEWRDAQNGFEAIGQTTDTVNLSDLVRGSILGGGPPLNNLNLSVSKKSQGGIAQNLGSTVWAIE